MSVNNFPAFAKLVAASFQERVRSEAVHVVDLDGDALWAAYLAAFPEGSDPLSYDCADRIFVV